MVFTEYATIPSQCPYCEHLLDAARGITTDRDPRHGDWTVCIQCARILLFDADVRVRKPFPGELEASWAITPGLKRLMESVVRRVREMDGRRFTLRPTAEPLPEGKNRHKRRQQQAFSHSAKRERNGH